MTSVEGRMSSSDAGGASIALQRSVRALDGVERIGRLLTLDLKGNELKVSSVSNVMSNMYKGNVHGDRADKVEWSCLYRTGS